MSVGKTADDGTVSVFMKEGVNVFKEADVLINPSSSVLEIAMADTEYHWCNNGGNGNRDVHPNKRGKYSDKPAVYTISLHRTSHQMDACRMWLPSKINLAQSHQSGQLCGLANAK